jgi:hypothetical protein
MWKATNDPSGHKPGSKSRKDLSVAVVEILAGRILVKK